MHSGADGSAAMLMGDYTLMRQGQVKVTWLTEGAQVYFTDMDGMRWTYEVSYVENLQPTQIEEMTEKTEESDEWDLTLFTCTTGGSARCAVRCVRTGYPALTTETAE